MNNQRSLLTWAYYCQGKSMDELRQSLLYTTLELETTRLKAQEELKMRDDQLNHLKGLLTEAISERDQAQEKCHRLAFENILLQQTAPISGISSIDDEPRLGLDSLNGFSSDDCEESIVSSPVADPIPPPLPPPMVEEQVIPLVGDKPWPEKGKFLQAVMKAGPLLQTLLLAGPLPQWRHPPPPIESYQIPTPPVAISPPPQLLHQGSVLNINGKRGLCQSSGSPTVAKHQKVVLQ